LGGTTFASGYLVGNGLVGLTTQETLSHRPPQAIVADLAEAILRTAQAAQEAGHTVSGAGIGVPAVIDPWAGKVLLPPNFAEGWAGFTLAQAIEGATGIPTVLINDARSFTFAESRMGAGKGAKHMLGLTVGTGIGGGLVLDGNLYLGRWGTAGEFGHQIYDPHGISCGCGSIGCIESYASGPAIVAAAARPLRQGRTPRLRELIEGSLDNLSPKAIAEAAVQGESECQEIYQKAGEAIGIGITNVMSLLGLERVVIGGGVAAAGAVLFEPICQTVLRYSKMTGDHHPEIVAAELDEPGIVGAAVWAREEIGVGG
jgi:glucokinase